MTRQLVTMISIILILSLSLEAQKSKVALDKAMETILSGDYLEFEAYGYGKNKQTASDAAMDGALVNLLGSLESTTIDAERETKDAENVKNLINTEVQGQMRSYTVINKVFSQENSQWEAKVTVRIPFNKRGLAGEVGKVLDRSFKENPPDHFLQNKLEFEAKKAFTLRRRNIELEAKIKELEAIIDSGLSTEQDEQELAKLKEDKVHLNKKLEEIKATNAELRQQVDKLQDKIANATGNQPEAVQLLDKGPYTGLIVDTRGLNLQMAMAPKIYTQSDRLVYGYISVIDDRWLNHGMVQYTKSVEEAKQSLADRVGDKPLVVKANKAKGKKPTDVVINDTSAVAIFASDVKDHFLEQGRVVFVID